MIHVFYGHAKRRDPRRPRCQGLPDIEGHRKRPRQIAFTYFGMPLCKACWDNWWRHCEDGEFDPPFDGIHHETSGEWL